MLDILLAIAPVFIVVMLGAVFKHKHLPGDEFWPYAEKLTYFVLLPCLFFNNIAHASFEGVAIGRLFLALCLAVGVMTAVMLALKRFIPADNPSFTSLFQGGIRFNNYIGVPSAVALYGQDGLVLSAVLIALLVPLINGVCIAVLSVYGAEDGNNTQDKKQKLIANIKRIITNPLIIACAAGGIFNGVGLQVPEVANRVLNILGDASLTLGLLAVGAGLNSQSARGSEKVIAISSVLKMILCPLVMGVVCVITGIGGVTAQVAMLYMALPTASSSYIMAKQLGGNAPLMAGITVIQTVVAAGLLPVLVILARAWFG